MLNTITPISNPLYNYNIDFMPVIPFCKSFLLHKKIVITTCMYNCALCNDSIELCMMFMLLSNTTNQ